MRQHRKRNIHQQRRQLIARWQTTMGAQLREEILAAVRAGQAIPAQALKGSPLGQATDLSLAQQAVRAPAAEATKRADLQGIDLSGQHLDGARFARADLQGANLARASLRQADLSYADLRHALLRNTDLGGANLRGANLDGAILENTRLEGATLTGALVTDETRLVNVRELPDDVIRWRRKSWGKDATKKEQI